MAALTSMIAAGSLALGAAGLVSQSRHQRQARNDANARAAEQTTRAREATALEGPELQDPRIKIGSSEKGTKKASTAPKRSAKRPRRNSTGVDTGRVFGSAGTSAARIGGL